MKKLDGLNLVDIRMIRFSKYLFWDKPIPRDHLKRQLSENKILVSDLTKYEAETFAEEIKVAFLKFWIDQFKENRFLEFEKSGYKSLYIK